MEDEQGEMYNYNDLPLCATFSFSNKIRATIETQPIKII
jgi:hypothetical protein